MRYYYKLTILVILAILVSGEIFMRYALGFCDAVLMRADEDYEYIAQPNQERYRFMNRIKYNSLSMRSDEIENGALRVLCVGDSILNGGTFTDQTELATTILSYDLSNKLKKKVQVLNISAGSWGPDNEAAYLKKHGTFGAKALVLVTSSHDARDTMTFIPIVGKLKYFPTKQYPLAWYELFDRYLSKKSTSAWLSKDDADAIFKKEHHIEQNSDALNPGFMELKKIADGERIPLFVYLHPEREELQGSKFNSFGNEIASFCKREGIHLIDGLSQGTTEDCYMAGDYIHLSPAGQRHLASCLYKHLVEVCTDND